MKHSARDKFYEGKVNTLDLSRLRLFADAVIDLAPVHFDVQAGAESPWGSVVALPLYPLDGIEARPGALPLSEDSRAQGRESVNAVGRDLASKFGLDAARRTNPGNQVEIHSLARVGETIQADSTLVGVPHRVGNQEMYFFETLTRYLASSGRKFVTERQIVVFQTVSSRAAIPS